MTVYFYGRNSDIGSFERGSSVQTQLSKCKSYCNIKDLTIDECVKKPNWKIWWFSTNDTGHEKWSTRQNEIQKRIRNLVKNFDQKHQITFYFDNFSYTQKNKIEKND